MGVCEDGIAKEASDMHWRSFRNYTHIHAHTLCYEIALATRPIYAGATHPFAIREARREQQGGPHHGEGEQEKGKHTHERVRVAEKAELASGPGGHQQERAEEGEQHAVQTPTRLFF